MPRILGGEIVIRGYPLAMVHAEKVVTAIARGTTSTRWRDFADLYLLSRHHPVDGPELAESIRHVARYREIALTPLSEALANYGDIGQQRWDAWRRRQRLDDRLPARFDDVVAAAITFADPAISSASAVRRPHAGLGVQRSGRATAPVQVGSDLGVDPVGDDDPGQAAGHHRSIAPGAAAVSAAPGIADVAGCRGWPPRLRRRAALNCRPCACGTKSEIRPVFIFDTQD